MKNCICVKQADLHTGHRAECPWYQPIDNVSRMLPEGDCYLNAELIEQVETFCITTTDPCFSPDKIVEINGYRFVSLKHIDDTFDQAAPEYIGDNPTRRQFWRDWFKATFGPGAPALLN